MTFAIVIAVIGSQDPGGAANRAGEASAAQSRARTPNFVVIHAELPPRRNPAVAAPVATAAPLRWELYNLDVDPSERVDLATRQPEMVARLLALAAEHVKTVVPVEDQIAKRGRGGS